MMRRVASSFLLILVAVLAAAVAAACAGGQKRHVERRAEGGEAASASGQFAEEGRGGGGDEGGGGGGGADGEKGAASSESGAPSAGAGVQQGGGGTLAEATSQEPPTADESAPAVTFVLRNTHDQELAFNMDLGWQPNLFAYTGKPPKAVSILMFPKFCTAACDAAADKRCPVCVQPDKTKDILAAQKMERVPPGGQLEVKWNGLMFVYEKVRGRSPEEPCECHHTEPAPAGTYTVKACGLRLTTTAEERSQLQCVEGKMKLPAEEELRVELDFGAPTTPGKPKKKGKH